MSCQGSQSGKAENFENPFRKVPVFGSVLGKSRTGTFQHKSGTLTADHATCIAQAIGRVF